MGLIAGLQARLVLMRAGLNLVRRQGRLRVRQVFKPVPGFGKPRKPPLRIAGDPPIRARWLGGSSRKPLFPMMISKSGIVVLPGELLGQPRRRLLYLNRMARATISMLFGSKFRYVRLARGGHTQFRRGNPDAGMVIVKKLVASAPSPAHKAVAIDLRKAAEAANQMRAVRISSHAELLPDDGNEKIISRKHRFLWISNPKVASRSLVNALCQADPDVEVFLQCTIDDLLALRPEARSYFSFAFVRNPFLRAVSFYKNKFLQEPSTSSQSAATLARRFYGLSADMSFEALCTWLSNPYGADAFADRHWLSQHIHIARETGQLPDFVGRYERIEDDFRTITRKVGLPNLRLPKKNESRERNEPAGLSAEMLLTHRARELLHRRYAKDFRIFGYDPKRPIHASISDN